MIYNGMIHRALSTLDTSHLHGTSPDSLESDPPLKTHRPTPTPRARPPRAATRLRHGLAAAAGVNRPTGVPVNGGVMSQFRAEFGWVVPLST